MSEHVTSWKRGLLWLPVFYLGMVGVLLLLHSEREELRKAKIDLAQELMNREAKLRQEGPPRPPGEQAGRILEALDELRAHKERHEFRVMALLGGAAVLYLLFIWSTWLVTAGAESGYERWSRWAVIVNPALATALALSPSVWLRLLVSVTRLIVVIGHQHAAVRIALRTGNYDIARRIDGIFNWFHRILLGSVVVLLVGGGQLRRWGVESWIEPALYSFAAIYLLTLSLSLWSLRLRLTNSDEGGDAWETPGRD